MLLGWLTQEPVYFVNRPPSAASLSSGQSSNDQIAGLQPMLEEEFLTNRQTYTYPIQLLYGGLCCKWLLQSVCWSRAQASSHRVPVWMLGTPTRQMAGERTSRSIIETGLALRALQGFSSAFYLPCVISTSVTPFPRLNIVSRFSQTMITAAMANKTFVMFRSDFDRSLLSLREVNSRYPFNIQTDSQPRFCHCSKFTSLIREHQFLRSSW